MRQSARATKNDCSVSLVNEATTPPNLAVYLPPVAPLPALYLSSTAPHARSRRPPLPPNVNGHPKKKEKKRKETKLKLGPTPRTVKCPVLYCPRLTGSSGAVADATVPAVPRDRIAPTYLLAPLTTHGQPSAGWTCQGPPRRSARL